MPKAPSGAVMIIARTATDSTILPQGRPIASGTEPIAAWTVALGRYAIIQNSRSFKFRGVCSIHRNTPAARNASARKTVSYTHLATYIVMVLQEDVKWNQQIFLYHIKLKPRIKDLLSIMQVLVRDCLEFPRTCLLYTSRCV